MEVNRNINQAKLAKCKKCGKPVGYISVQTQNLIEGANANNLDLKIVAVCLNCNKPARYTIP